MHRFVLVNDSILDSAEKSLSPGQVGLLSGWGVFSTIKVLEGVLFAWERHWARMTRDAALFRIPMPSDPEWVKPNLLKLVEANGGSDCTLRVVIVRNKGGMWEGPSERAVDVIALTAPFKDWGRGVKLDYVKDARHAASPFSGTKILSWSMNLTWLEEAQSRGFDEVVLLNEHGGVSECTSANIFAAYGDTVFTPPLSAGCLPGITREVLLGEVQVPGFRIAEKDLTVAELESADEVFITSTTRDLLPVVQLGNTAVTNAEKARPALQDAFSRFIDEYVAAHKPARVG